MKFKLFLIVLLSIQVSIYCFTAVSEPLKWSFPKDHGSHPEYEVEWWYFTGHLTGKSEYGFEITFFRVSNDIPTTNLTFHPKEFIITHFALTDVKRQKFYHYEKINRYFPEITYTTQNNLNLKNGPYSIFLDKDGFFHIKAEINSESLTLKIKPTKSITFNGNNGLHKKSNKENHASHYYTITRLEGLGEISTDKITETVTASAWMDHEIFTNTDFISTGWNWFACQFDDNTELMLYQLKTKNNTFVTMSEGSYIDELGNKTPIYFKDQEIAPLEFWKDPKTKIKYPIKWNIKIKSLDINITLTATLNNQLVKSEILGKNKYYWEGKSTISGSKTGNAYIELVNN